MGQIVELDHIEYTLRITIGQNDWCDCDLIGKTTGYHLGSETWLYISSRLTHALCDVDERPVSGDFSWVLSLAENHCSLYIAREDEVKVLRWQDANAKPLADLPLTPNLTSAWCRKLQQGPVRDSSPARSWVEEDRGQ